MRFQSDFMRFLAVFFHASYQFFHVSKGIAVSVFESNIVNFILFSVTFIWHSHSKFLNFHKIVYAILIRFFAFFQASQEIFHVSKRHAFQSLNLIVSFILFPVTFIWHSNNKFFNFHKIFKRF